MRAHQLVKAIVCLAPFAGACKVDGNILNVAPGSGGRGGGGGTGGGPVSTGGGAAGTSATGVAGRGGAAGTGSGGSLGGIGGSSTAAGGSSAGAGGQAAGAGGSSGGATDAGTIAADARYLLVFYTAHGTVLDAWRPSGGAGDLTSSTILQPLAPYKEAITVIDGLDNVSHPGQVTSTHVDGPAPLLTARGQGGPSIDYVFGTRQAVAVIQTRVDFASMSSPEWINYSPSGIQLVGTLAPLTFEQNLFAGSSLPLPVPNPPDNPGTGSPNTYDDAGVDGGTVDPTAVAQAFGQIVAAAFSDNLLRSATLMWNLVGDQTPVAGTGSTYRALAEASGTSPAREQFISVQTSFAQALANIVALFRSTAVGPTTTLLDRSLIVWISETGEASSESGHNIPVVLIGNLGGAFRQGQYLQYSGRTQADLMQTIAKAAGQPSFGDPALSSGVLTELLAP